MRSVYGKECPNHPELLGRRYLPNNACIKCHSEWNKVAHLKRKAERAAQAERLAKCEALLREVLVEDDQIPTLSKSLVIRINEVLGDDS